MANTKILSAKEAAALGCGDTDTAIFNRATQRAKAGLEAYYSRHSYSQTNLTKAVYTANERGLVAACLEVAQSAREHGWNDAAWIALFLDKLYPANEIAARRISEMVLYGEALA